MFATTSLSCIAKLLSCTMLYYPHGNTKINKRTEYNNKNSNNYAQEVSSDWKTILVFNKEMTNELCGLHFTQDATNDKAVHQIQLLENNKRYNRNKETQGTEQPMSLYTSRFYLDKVDEELLASCEPLNAIFANSKTPHHRAVYLDSVNGSLPVNWFELGKAMFNSTNLIIHLSVQERAHNTLIDCSTNTSVNVEKDSCVAAETKAVTVVADATVTSPEVKVKRKYTKRKLLMQSNKSQLKKNRKRVDNKNNKNTTNILQETATTTTIKKERRGRPRKVRALQSSSIDQEHRSHKSAHKLQNKITTSSQSVHSDEIERIINQIKAERHGNNINKKRKAITTSTTATASNGDVDEAANKEDNKQQEQVSNSNKKEDEKTGESSETDTKLKRKLIRKQIKELMKELKEEHQKQKQQYQAQQSISQPNVLMDKPTRQLRKKKIQAMMTDHTSASITSSTPDKKSSIVHSNQSNTDTINSTSNITESEKDAVQVVHDAIKQYGENYNDKNENCISSSNDKMYNTTLTGNTNNEQIQKTYEQDVNIQKRKRGRPRKYVTLPSQQQQTQISVILPVQQHDTTTRTPITSFTENEIHNNEITF